MVLSRLTKITGPGVATDTNCVGNNAEFTGITTTATSFNIGVTTIHSHLIEAHNIKSTGIITATGGSFSGNVTAVDGTFSGNVSIAGTLTYEDVTNIDSVGIITAPALDVDDFLDVGSSIKLGNAGVITATSFVGSGAALTGIDATSIKDSGGNVKIQAQASGAIHSGVSTFQDIDVDGHTNLDNVSVSGVTTFTNTLDNNPICSIINNSQSNAHGLKISSGSDGTGAKLLELFSNNQSSETSRFQFIANGTFKLPGVIQVGASQELLLSTHAITYSGSNNLHIRGNGTSQIKIQAKTAEQSIICNSDGSVELYYDNVKRFETTSQGIEITGHSELDNVNISGLTTAVNVDINGDLDVDGHTNLDNVSIAGVTTFTGVSNHSSSLNMLNGNNIVLQNDANSANCQIDCYGGAGFRLTSYNQTMFTCENGSNTKLYTDSGTSRLEITHAGNVLVNTGALHIPDALQHLGDTDTQIRFPAADTITAETAGSERLRITSNGQIRIDQATSANNGIRMRPSGWNYDFRMGAVSSSGGSIWLGQNYEPTGGTRDSASYGTNYIRFTTGGEIYFGTGATDTNPSERLRIDSGGKIKFFPAGESGGAQGVPLYLQVQSDMTAVNTPTGGSDCTGLFRIEDRGGNNNRFVGIDLRNRNSGDIRILNKDIGVSNGAVLVFAVDDNGQFDGSGTIRQYLQINGQGQTSAITLSGAYHVVASARDGSSSANAAASAWEIKKTLGPAAKTGYYYLKNPYDGTANQWWCDMETDGGGWILIAHTGDGQMSALNTSDGNHWYNRSNKGGFDTVGSGYYKGGGYWRATNGAWAENTCGQLMWDVRTHNSEFNNKSNDKVVFNWGTDQPLPSGGSAYSNIPNSSNRRFNEWCYAVENAPGFNPANYHQNARANTINGNNHFTEHMVMTFGFRGTGGGGDNGDHPYWMIGSHHDGLHQHYEESLSGGDGVYGDGGYQVVSNEDTGWGGGGTDDGYRRIARHSDTGTCNIWLR